MKNKVFLILLVTFLICSIAISSIYLRKPDIHTARYYDLIELQSIGDDLASKIIEYLNENENAVIDDLKAIKGIGEKRIDILKGAYND